MPRPRPETCPFQSLTLHEESYGSGPALLLGHGFGGSARNFRPQARLLQSQYQVLTWDARGHARSAAPEAAEAYRLPCFTGDILGLLDRRQIERAVLGGLSMGAAVALHCALYYPGRVKALVLASYPASAKMRDWALRFAAAIERRGLSAAGSEFVWAERSRFDPKGAELIRQGFFEHKPGALQAILRELLAALPAIDELAPELAALDIPVLIVAGSNDAPSVEASEQLSRLVPRSILHVIPGAGHIVNLESPAAFNELLADFLARYGT